MSHKWRFKTCGLMSLISLLRPALELGKSMNIDIWLLCEINTYIIVKLQNECNIANDMKMIAIIITFYKTKFNIQDDVPNFR